MSRKSKIEKAKQIIAERQSGIDVPRITRRSLPCCEEEAIIEWCTTCSGPAAELRHVRGCSLYETATRGRNAAGIASCVNCPDYRVEVPPWENGVLKFDEYNLYPNVPGKRFNSSIIPWEDGYVFAWRNGWAGSDLYACRMDRQFQPIGRAVKLEIRHPDSSYGREDPRLFIFQNQLHISFTGVVGRVGQGVYHTNVLYARLDNQLKVDTVYSPRYRNRTPSEKNWIFFEHDKTLYCVYSVNPHQVLRVVGERTELAHETPTLIPWSGGVIRGGASPVRVGNEFWAFAHDRVHAGLAVYRTLLHTFSTTPPFAPLRYIPRPILVANSVTKPEDQYCAVVFASGAVRAGTKWVVSHGVHDRFTELHQWDHDELDQRLISLR